jgi:hypothetical protein
MSCSAKGWPGGPNAPASRWLLASGPGIGYLLKTQVTGVALTLQHLADSC